MCIRDSLIVANYFKGKQIEQGKKLTAAEKQRRYREKRKLDPSREEEDREKHKARKV